MKKANPMPSPAQFIAGAYAALATAWVVGSDWTLDAVGLGKAALGDLLLVQNAKGVAFVVCTSLILWVFLRREFARRNRSEEALRATLDRLAQSEADLRSIIANLPDAFYRVDPDGRIVMASPQFAREFGYDPDEVVGIRIAHHYVEPNGRERFLTALEQAGGQIRHYSAAMQRRDGTPLWMSINAHVRRDPSGRSIGVEGVARNITEQHVLEERLRYLAGHDALTGLCNRIRFEDRLDHAIARARRENRTLALLFLDLDGFKEINDTYGHHRGDDTLVAVGQRLVSVLRDSDSTARMGGDEFAVLLEGNITAEAARIVAGKIIAVVGEPLPGIDARVSTSVGVALYPRDGTDSDALLKSADQAMYRAKRLGKNRFELGPF